MPINFKARVEELICVKFVVGEKRFCKTPRLVNLLVYKSNDLARLNFKRRPNHFTTVIRFCDKRMGRIVLSSLLSILVYNDVVLVFVSF